MQIAAKPDSVTMPRRWHWLMRGFKRYCLRYVRKHIHAVRLAKSGSNAVPADEPLLIVLNHPSWWDPLIGVVLSDRFPNRDHFAAIDSAAVEKYPFFQKLGFVGVRGAGRFLRIGDAILSEPNRAFWVTAQGRFTDVRERPLALRSGVGHLAARLERGIVLPVALELCFWNERTPEALIRFGEPLAIVEHPGLDGKQWMNLIEGSLTNAVDALSTDAMSRDEMRFTTLLDGRTGVGGIYDRFRRLFSWLRGEQFDPSHAAAMKERA